MKKVLIWIERSFIPNVATMFFAISCLSMFGEALSRRFFNYSFAESEEFICYTLVWAVFLSLAEGGRRGCHIRISLIVSKFSPAKRKCFNVFNTACGIIYTSLLTCSAFAFIGHLKEAMLVSYSPLRWPLWIVFLAVLFGGVLLFIYYIEKMILVLSNKEESIEW